MTTNDKEKQGGCHNILLNYKHLAHADNRDNDFRTFFNFTAPPKCKEADEPFGTPASSILFKTELLHFPSIVGHQQFFEVVVVLLC